MENNHITNQDAVAEFIDNILAQKYPGQPVPPEEHEAALKEINGSIAKSVVGKLDKEQLIVYNILLKDETATQETFQKFFFDAGVSLEEIVTQTFVDFAKKYTGGNNEQ